MATPVVVSKTPTFRVVTHNSVYGVQIVEGGFAVRRISSTWNARPMARDHFHVSSTLRCGIGQPMVTTELVTSKVVAVLPN